MANPLARVVMENVSRKVNENYGLKSADLRENVRNITDKDEELIRNIINKNSRIERNVERKSMVTLDEVANMIKGNK